MSAPDEPMRGNGTGRIKVITDESDPPHPVVVPKHPPKRSRKFWAAALGVPSVAVISLALTYGVKLGTISQAQKAQGDVQAQQQKTLDDHDKRLRYLENSTVYQNIMLNMLGKHDGLTDMPAPPDKDGE